MKKKSINKKPSVKRLKKKLWKLFSQYIRMKYADSNGMCKCVTCGAIKPWRELQAGHYIDGRCNSVLFEEDLVHPQCYRDNIMLHGLKSEYAPFMYEKYGKERVDELRRQSKYAKKFSIDDLEIMIDRYSDKVEKLKKEVI